MCNTSFSLDFVWKIHLWYYFRIRGHLQGRKGIAKVKNKMAARYLKVNYDCSTNEARNKCNTSFSCDFDRAIHFLYYFHDSRYFSRSNKQNYHFNQIKLGTCVIPLFHVILSEKSIYGIILLIQGHFQGRKVISKVKM